MKSKLDHAGAFYICFTTFYWNRSLVIIRLLIFRKPIPGHQDKIKDIFERKFQADDSKKQYGYGLGLNIVKEALQMLGGEVSVKSEEGKGTTFQYKLPLFSDQTVSVVNETFVVEPLIGL